MIGLLRFVGIMNAAVWFGAAVFFLLGADPAVTNSQEIKHLLGPKNFPYFSVVINHIIATRYLHLYLACSIIAVVHMMAEWLYFGRYPNRVWLGLILGLCLGGLAQTYLFQPKLAASHRLQYTHPQQRESAGRAFRAWRAVSLVIHTALLGGIAVYLWRVANPSDQTRFVSTAKFRS